MEAYLFCDSFLIVKAIFFYFAGNPKSKQTPATKNYILKQISKFELYIFIKRIEILFQFLILFFIYKKFSIPHIFVIACKFAEVLKILMMLHFGQVIMIRFFSSKADKTFI